jgi:hypothetical protein
MSGYETDFITGRAISSEDRALAIVIIPASGGYPDVVKFAAQGPIYPHDRFEPLSLPLHGSLNRTGFFTPDEGQIGLTVFEALIQMPWARFREKVLNEPEGKITIGRKGLDQERLAPGLAIIHQSTADALIGMARTGLDTRADAVTAAKITIDAKRRVAKGQDKFWNISEMEPVNKDTYTTLDGEEMAVPPVSNALRDLEPKLLSNFAKRSLRRFHDDAENTDGTQLVSIYEALGDFEKISYGMRMMRRYLEPSAHARGDNLVIVTKFNIKTIDAAIEGFSERNGFDHENENMDGQLEKIAESLRVTLEKVEAEMAKRQTFHI